MLWSETCLRGKIATLVFGANVGIAPQLKQKRNSCAGKKWRRFAVLFFGYICLEPSNNFVGITEAVARRCSVEKMFLEILRNF